MPPDVPLPDEIKIAAEEAPKPEEAAPAMVAGKEEVKATPVEGEQAEEAKPEESEESGDTQTQ